MFIESEITTPWKPNLSRKISCKITLEKVAGFSGSSASYKMCDVITTSTPALIPSLKGARSIDHTSSLERITFGNSLCESTLVSP